MLIIDATLFQECYCHALLSFTLISVLLVYFLAPSRDWMDFGGWVRLVRYPLLRGVAASWGWWAWLDRARTFCFLFRFCFLVRSICFHAHSSLPLCLPGFFELFHAYCSHEQFREKTFAWVPHYLYQYWMVFDFCFGLIFAFQELNYNNNNSNTAYYFYFNCSSELCFYVASCNYV